MGGEEIEVLPELEKRFSEIFSDFMTKISKFEEMVSVASRLLVGFHQQVELLRRPSLDITSEIVDKILKANQTERVKAYVQSGCKNVHDGVQAISKLNAYQRGLQDHVSKAKGLLDELEMLMDDLVREVRTLQCQDEHVCNGLLVQKEEMGSALLRRTEASDYMSMVGIIYSMVTQDYAMQEKIVLSLSLDTLSGELEGYYLMWSLRPFINDEIMNQAWKYIR